MLSQAILVVCSYVFLFNFSSDIFQSCFFPPFLQLLPDHGGCRPTQLHVLSLFFSPKPESKRGKKKSIDTFKMPPYTLQLVRGITFFSYPTKPLLCCVACGTDR